VEKEGFNVHQVETEIYKLATKMVDFLVGGISVKKGVSTKGVDASELKMGIGVEKEHTFDKDTAERIAVDHLSEIGDYYTRLKKMEDEALSTEKPKKIKDITESINIDKLKRFDKKKTQKAIKNAIDTLTQLDDGEVFDTTDMTKVQALTLLLQKIWNKFEYSIK